MIEELFEKACKYTNYKESNYWIYSVENKVLKRDDKIKKYLIVRFYNHYFNENNDLKELYLDVKGRKELVTEFTLTKKYNDKNIMGLAIEISLEDVIKDVSIVGYKNNDYKIIFSNQTPIEHIAIEENYQKLNVLKSAFSKKTVNMIPAFGKDWFCSCGCYNYEDSMYCEQCGTSKKELSEMINYNSLNLISKLQSKIKFSHNETFQETINKYISAIKYKYGIDENLILENLDIETLIEKYYKENSHN